MFVINESDSKAINYLRSLSDNHESKIFICPWGGVVIRNCNKSDGDLLDFKSVEEYLDGHKDGRYKNIWLYMKLKVIKLVNQYGNFEPYGIFICPDCEGMAALENLVGVQNPEAVKAKLCVHSLVTSMIIGDWMRPWSFSEMNVEENECIHVIDESDVNFFEFIPHSSMNPSLAVIKDEKNLIAVLFGVTARQSFPFCSLCTRRKCKHYQMLVSLSNIDGHSSNANANDDIDSACDSSETHVDEEKYICHNYTEVPRYHIR